MLPEVPGARGGQYQRRLLEFHEKLTTYLVDTYSEWTSLNALFEMEEESRMEMYVGNIFEPLTRGRSNTWPQPRPEGYVDGPPLIDGAAMTGNAESLRIDPLTQQNSPGQGAGPSAIKKKSPRQNAWGKLSYAELITQAINSSKDQRLTLAQIYEWMVKNVQYFRDKGETNSSAGWKNSVRHNLSLHNCFIRVPNESSGKSSWWTINPDVKSGKTTRKRAASMEAGKFEKRRTRVKKLVEASRKANPHLDVTSSASNCVSEGIEPFHYGVSPLQHIAAQSPAFQARASSSASSAGRLSPILAANEPEWTYGHAHGQTAASPADQLTVTPLHQINHTSALDQQPMRLSATCQMGQPEAPGNDLQSLPVACSFDRQVAQMCPVHRLDVCNCDLSMLQMDTRTQAANAAASHAHCATDGPNHYFNATYGNQYGVMASQTTLMPIQEMADFGSIADLQIESQQPMVRNNSMLDDIDEIIKKDQYAAIDLVNTSMSTALYISGNNPVNSVGQNSWIHL
ncbi:hypothetical protein TSAR_001244 [Trichomalopsis sarcophagae]|uniref:Forkhead box protein O n=1 Tax=Trichomalopsis sarcophagae TaxID=543379 RepID=A0A232ESF6_9HYME|nr:hypothetical protein TSAR_001244 [Trichomalopsis sarcophagae]